MPSLGHVAVGLAAARLHSAAGRQRLVPAMAFSALALFPDLDVLARRFGAVRGSPWLHRGALHSLLVAAAAGIVAALVAGAFGRSRLRTAAVAVLVAASHGVLDAFTYGGGGVMFLWPSSVARCLAPWNLFSAAPIGLGIVSEHGLTILLREAVWFSPLLVYALWPPASAPRSGSPSAARAP